MKFLHQFNKTYSAAELAQFKFLAKNRLFSALTKDEMAVFLPYLHVRTYEENEAVFFRNDPSQALYIVKSGVVATHIDIKDKFEFLKHIHVGDSFGNSCLIQGTRRLYNAFVESDDCELYVIPQVNILEIFNDHVAIKAQMLSALCEMYQETNANLFKAYQSTFGFFDLGKIYQ